MFQVVGGYNYEQGKYHRIICVNSDKRECIKEENILKLQKKKSENNTGNKLNQWILKRDFNLAGLASSAQRDKTEKRDKLVPRERILARHAGAPPTEGPFGMIANNYDIQEAPDDETKSEKNKGNE